MINLTIGGLKAPTISKKHTSLHNTQSQFLTLNTAIYSYSFTCKHKSPEIIQSPSSDRNFQTRQPCGSTPTHQYCYCFPAASLALQ
ncbi:hypothetical protein Hanom_Chr13g01230231 [Helianthus anomalus]